MRSKLTWIFAGMAIFGLSIVYLPTNKASAAVGVTLTVLNPRGEITLPPISAPSPRIADLAGKEIGLYWNGKPGGDNFWNAIEGLMKEKFPKTSVVRYNAGFDVGDQLAAKIAKEVDAFFYGVGD